MQLHGRHSRSRQIAIFALASVFLGQSWQSPAQAQIARKSFIKGGQDALRVYESEHSRCGLEAPYLALSPNLYVLSSQRTTTLLRPGDHVYSIADKQVRTYDGMKSILATTSPDAIVRVGVRRHGQTLQMDIQCGDVLPLYSSLADIERAIVEQQFDSCLNKVNQFENFFGRTAISVELTYYCAVYAGRLRNRGTRAAEYYQVLRIAIEETKWDPSVFADTLDLVLSSGQWFADADQAALYSELESQLEAAVKSVTTHPSIPVETTQ